MDKKKDITNYCLVCGAWLNKHKAKYCIKCSNQVNRFKTRISQAKKSGDKNKIKEREDKLNTLYL